MKIERLIGILSVLLQKDMVTAADLADMFEVSRRTIQRDIEDLCRAGIPLMTRQGTGGGISIMENYRMDRTVFTAKEMKDILTGIHSLDSIHRTNKYGQLMEKVCAGSSDFVTGDQNILIDLSSWHKKSLIPKIEILRTAIEQCRIVKFLYFSPEKSTRRRIEPYYLIFRWSSWYVWGWCCKCNESRLFKLNRMEELELTENIFEKRKVSLPDFDYENIFPGKFPIKAVFSGKCRWRLAEEYGKDSFQEQKDGTLLFYWTFSDKNHLISWLLTFGADVKVLEPSEIKEEIKAVVEQIRRNYQEE